MTGKQKIYLGKTKQRRWEIFRHSSDPTDVSHGNRYLYVVGPFRTIKGAEFMAEYGDNNPHCQTVSQAEKLAHRAHSPAFIGKAKRKLAGLGKKSEQEIERVLQRGARITRGYSRDVAGRVSNRVRAVAGRVTQEGPEFAEHTLQRGAHASRTFTRNFGKKILRGVKKRFAHSPEYVSSDWVWVNTDDGRIYTLIETDRRSGGVTLRPIGFGKEKFIYVPKMRFERTFVPRKALPHDRPFLVAGTKTSWKARSPHARVPPHMWVMSKGPMGYIVSIGDPRDTRSTLKRTFQTKTDMREWAHDNIGTTISAAHIVDWTGLKLIPKAMQEEADAFAREVQRGSR
jgi:hypothetical protein